MPKENHTDFADTNGDPSNKGVKKARRRAMRHFGVRIVPRALRHWIGREVGFTTLPIIVVLVLVLFFKQKSQSFWIAPEWSFAAVVLLGSSIDHLSDLRERGTLLPYKMNFLSKLLLVLLVLAVVMFALASSVDKAGSALASDQRVLVIGQLLLFGIAVFLSFLLELLTLFAEEERDLLPKWMSPYRFYKHLRDRLDRAKKDIRYSAVAIEKRKSDLLTPTDPQMRSQIWVNAKTEEIENELQCIENLLERVRLELEAWKAE